MTPNKRHAHFSCLLPLLFGSVLMIGGLQKACAGMITSDMDEDVTVSYLASSHDVAEVREAIAACREKKYDTAVPILKKHAVNNDVGATFVLAKLHQAGLGVEKSEEIAASYLQANADAGHAPSMIALAEIREKSDPNEAISIYKKAAASGNALGHLKLGDIYERGLFGKRANPKLAFSSYEKAAKAANPLGYYCLLYTSPSPRDATLSRMPSSA